MKLCIGCKKKQDKSCKEWKRMRGRISEKDGSGEGLVSVNRIRNVKGERHLINKKIVIVRDKRTIRLSRFNWKEWSGWRC